MKNANMPYIDSWAVEILTSRIFYFINFTNLTTAPPYDQMIAPCMQWH